IMQQNDARFGSDFSSCAAKKRKLASFQSAVWQQNLIHCGPVIAITAALVRRAAAYSPSLGDRLRRRTAGSLIACFGPRIPGPFPPSAGRNSIPCASSAVEGGRGNLLTRFEAFRAGPACVC